MGVNPCGKMLQIAFSLVFVTCDGKHFVNSHTHTHTLNLVTLLATLTDFLFFLDKVTRQVRGVLVGPAWLY